MAIVPTDIVFRLSVTTGAAGNIAVSTPAESLGKYASITVWAAGANTLFDDITATENAASQVDYRCVFVLNNHATLTLKNAVVYISTEVAGGANVTLAVDNIAAQSKGAAAAQAAVIATATTAPTGVGAFSSPTTPATGLPLGDIPPGDVRGVWVCRSATNSIAQAADGFTLAVSGDTDA